MKLKILTASILGFLLFIGIGQIGNVQAANSLDNKKQEIEGNLNEVEKDILKAADKVNDLNENIAVLEAAIASNDKEVDIASNEVEKYDEEIEDIKTEIKKIEKEIEERNVILKERLSSYQNTGGDIGYLEVIFGSAGFEDFISRFTAVTTITKADNELVEMQKKSVEEVEKKEAEVEAKLTEAEETKDKLTKINDVKKDQKQDLIESVESVKSEQKKLESKKEAYVQEGNDIKALEAKAEAIKQAKIKQDTSEEVEQISTKNNDEKVTEKKIKTESKTTPKKSKTKSESTSKQKEETTKETSTPSKPKNDSLKEFTMSATAYTAKCAGCSGITATGINLNNNPNAKVVAVDPSVIPLGSRVWVSGYGEAIAGDTGGAIKGNRIDLHFPSKDAAYAFGRKSVTVKILK